MKHHHWLTQSHTAAFTKRRLANRHDYLDESLRDFAYVHTLTEALPTRRRSCVQKWRVNATGRRRFYFYERPFRAWMDSRQVIPGVEYAAIEDAFRDAQRERYVASHNGPSFMNLMSISIRLDM